jgi:hypothetical protein
MKLNPRLALVISIGVALTSAAAQAHPGHGQNIGPLIRHPFAGWDHFFASAAFVTFVGGVVWLGARRAGMSETQRRVAVGGAALIAVASLI